MTGIALIAFHDATHEWCVSLSLISIKVSWHACFDLDPSTQWVMQRTSVNIWRRVAWDLLKYLRSNNGLIDESSLLHSVNCCCEIAKQLMSESIHCQHALASSAELAHATTVRYYLMRRTTRFGARNSLDIAHWSSWFFLSLRIASLQCDIIVIIDIISTCECCRSITDVQENQDHTSRFEANYMHIPYGL